MARGYTIMEISVEGYILGSVVYKDNQEPTGGQLRINSRGSTWVRKGPVGGKEGSV